MSKIKTSDFAKGMFILHHGQPYQIVEFQFVNPGKGSAFIRTKLKSLKSDRVLEFTYKSGETAEEVPVATREMQYLYKTESDFIFMDSDSYNQFSLTKDIAGNFGNYLKEGNNYQILILDDNAVGLRMPKKVKLEVTNAQEGAKGNTVTGAKKTVELETGVNITVPLFIKKGDMVAVNPETGEYLERVSQ